MKNKTRKASVFLLVAALVILAILPSKGQAYSSQTQWVGGFPAGQYVLDQTLSDSNNDNYAEVSLSANLDAFAKDIPHGLYQFNLGVAAAANTRRAWGYTYSSGGISGFDQNAVHTVTLPPDSGFMLKFSDYPQYYMPDIMFYGATYSQVFISSNGFVILDPRAYNDNGGQWTSPNQVSLPSRVAAPCLIAPFWRHLKGGTIKWGFTNVGGLGSSGGLFVQWQGFEDNDDTHTQTFAVVFFDWDVEFIYGSVTNDEPTSIGIQDQTQNRGCSVTQPTTNTYVHFEPVYPGCGYMIRYLKISCSKTRYEASRGWINNDQGSITIYGDPSAGGSNAYYPGGINVEQMTSENNAYSQYHPVWSAGKWVISTLSQVKTFAKFLGPVGYVIGTAELINELCPAPKTEVHNADPPTGTAYTYNLADGFPRDCAVFSTFVLYTNPMSLQRLSLNVELGYWDMGAHMHTVTLQTPLILELNPYETNWYGRTNPDAHTYTFNQYHSGSGETVCHVDAIGTIDDYEGYEMMGWNKLGIDPANDYTVRPDGTIRVEGDFRQLDTAPSGYWNVIRGLNVYVMYSDDLNTIVARKQIVSPNDGTDWLFRSVTVGDGLLIPGEHVKIGIGRTVVAGGFSGYDLQAEWKNINVHDNSNGYVLTVYSNAGGTTSVLGEVPVGIRTPPFPYIVTAYPNAGNMLDYWILDGIVMTGTPSNQYTVYMDHDHSLQPVFAPQLSVSVSPPSVIMDLGQTKTFTASVAGGISPYSYQWYLNGGAVSGATGSSWSFTPPSTGSYQAYVRTADFGGTVATSSAASISVNPAISVSVSPSSAIMDADQTKVFSCTALGGTPSYTYRWGVGQSEFFALIAASNANPSSSSWAFTPSSPGSCYVASVVADSVNGVGYETASVTVNPAISVSISPSSATMDVNQHLTFTSAASGGTPGYTYRWGWDTYELGAITKAARASPTGNSWTFTPTSQGQYYVASVVEDSIGYAVASTASVRVNLAPSVTISPSSVYMYWGNSQTFTSTVSALLPYTYQWYLNGAIVPGATSASWVFTPTSTGSYSVYLKVRDSAGNVGTSNTAYVTVTTGGGGGGGGCPYIFTWNGSQFIPDNNLVPASENNDGSDVRDFYALQNTLLPTAQTKSMYFFDFKIGEFENEQSSIDQVKFMAVDHAADVNVATTPDGEIVTYRSPLRPISCTDDLGNDVLSRISNMDGNIDDASTFFQGFAGNYLILDFGKITSSHSALILRDDQKCNDICIEVQVLDANGQWQTIETLHPRERWAVEAVDVTDHIAATGKLLVRLLWTAPHKLDYVGLDISSPAPYEVRSAALISATHSESGNVLSQLKNSDDRYAQLSPGQTISLTFALPKCGTAEATTYIFYSEGHYYTIG